MSRVALTAGKIGSTVFSNIKLFSTLQAKVPSELTAGISDGFRGVDPKSVKMNIDQGAIARSATKTVKWLKDKEQGGCEESSFLLKAMRDYQDPQNLALHLQGAPKEESAAEHLAHVLAFIIGGEREITSRGRIDEKGGKIANVPPHSDGAKHSVEITLTILSGIVSDGSVRTYTLDINRVYERMSEQSREILAEPIFRYAPDISPMDFNERSSCKLPILYEDGDGLLKVNFTYDGRPVLFCNYEKSKFSEDEVEQAVEEMQRIVGDMYKSNEVTPFFIKAGDFLLIKNRQVLHGRDGSSEEDRILVFGSYGPSTKPCSGESSSLIGNDPKTAGL